MGLKDWWLDWQARRRVRALPPLTFKSEHIEPLRAYGRLSLFGEHADLPPGSDPVADLSELRRIIADDSAKFDEVNNWMTASAISHEGFMMIGVWRLYVDVIGEEASADRCSAALEGFTKAMGSLRLGNRRQFMTEREIAEFVKEYGSEPPQTTAEGAPPDWGPGGRMPVEPPSPVV